MVFGLLQMAKIRRLRSGPADVMIMLARSAVQTNPATAMRYIRFYR